MHIRFVVMLISLYSGPVRLAASSKRRAPFRSRRCSHTRALIKSHQIR
jgi:hypothetical protein